MIWRVRCCEQVSRCHTVCISWRLIVLVEFQKIQNFKTILKNHLTCIPIAYVFLSVRADSKKPVYYDVPCKNLSLQFTLVDLPVIDAGTDFCQARPKSTLNTKHRPYLLAATMGWCTLYKPICPNGCAE